MERDARLTDHAEDGSTRVVHRLSIPTGQVPLTPVQSAMIGPASISSKVSPFDEQRASSTVALLNRNHVESELSSAQSLNTRINQFKVIPDGLAT